MALLAAVGIFVIVLISRTADDSPDIPSTISIPGIPGVVGPRPDAGVAPSQLQQSNHPGWIPVAAPPIEGSFTNFDPVANLPWALGMARAWSTDAQLGSIYIEGVRADGTLDLSSRDDWDVDYRLFSPALRVSARQMAEVSEEIVRSELRFKVGEGQVTALVSKHHGLERVEDPPPYEPGCAFSQVMSIAVEEGLQPRPSYGIVMHHVNGQWRWAVSGKDIPSVMVPASACAAAQ